ncbi:cupin domain-containing protein [Noviherbaspirillum saxi]|uniref:Cupin domain-containing protein n=1 Tax=Noviherbaspirillum saxi TaxID=2320863 RepID=A0A3A3FHT6_9BURK|nr:cupin domain-containing protein [Noviherbaspirillum saxi]RJF95068.1 cupin domain-containing protein [Noviherbaspirillum saxi]
MTHLSIRVLPLILLASSGLYAGAASSANETPRPENARQPQVITRPGSQASVKGPPEYFTGSVRVDPMFAAKDPAPYSGAMVTFEPGARSAWHTHPAGQYLVVTSGVGWTQEWGGSVAEIRAGDVIWCPPGVKHWHGAAPTTAMSHIALTGTLNGKNVEWMEKVSDEQYRK